MSSKNKKDKKYKNTFGKKKKNYIKWKKAALKNTPRLYF